MDQGLIQIKNNGLFDKVVAEGREFDGAGLDFIFVYWRQRFDVL
jgi:hypothetical protein